MGYRRPDAVVPSLIETWKLGGIDLLAYLTGAITRIVNGHTNSRLDELLFCSYQPAAVKVW